MKKPNLFKYATSELSQDAFICYLLEWAKAENKNIDKKTHLLGVEFLNSLLSKFDKPTQSSFEKIEIKKQYHNLDVFVIVDDKYGIIIEDKTNTKNHSNQLNRYFENMKKEYSNFEILPIYFKTGDQSNYDSVYKAGYKVYLRKDFLNILNNYQGQNNVILEYKNYLQNIENSINSYKSLPIDKWTKDNWNTWKGFFIELKNRLNEGNWGYVSNPNGGFLGYWWSGNKTYNDEYSLYLQIEHNLKAVTIKLSSKTGNKLDKSLLNKWKKHILKSDNIIVRKPVRVRNGKTSTIGIVDNFLKVNDENLVDMDKTIEFLKEVEKFKTQKFKEFELL